LGPLTLGDGGCYESGAKTAGVSCRITLGGCVLAACEMRDGGLVGEAQPGGLQVVWCAGEGILAGAIQGVSG